MQRKLLFFAIDFAAMLNVKHNHGFCTVINIVQNAIVSNAQSKKLTISEFLRSVWLGGFLSTLQSG